MQNGTDPQTLPASSLPPLKGLTSLISIATAFVPILLFAWDPFLQSPSSVSVVTHAIFLKHIYDFVIPLFKKTFYGFLLENPTFQILYNSVIASVHLTFPLIAYIYLMFSPTKSNYSLFPKCILYLPTSMPWLLPFSLPRMPLLHLCLWKLYPFLKTQL